MKTGTPISVIMTKHVITLKLTDDLEAAEVKFKKNKIRHIPVMSGHQIKGMLSYTDLLRISFADAVDENEEYVDSVVYNLFTIEQVMTKNVVSIPSTTTIKEAAEILAHNEFHALPVVDDGNLIGIVTTTDLIKYLISQC